MNNEDIEKNMLVRRLLAETVDEYNTGNRITDRAPPPFKSISQPLGRIDELQNYLERESGADFAYTHDKKSHLASLKRILELLKLEIQTNINTQGV